MKVHYVHELYGNNVTKRISVFSSKKKAVSYIEYIVKCAVQEDRWTSKELTDFPVEIEHGVRIIPPNGRTLDSELLLYFSTEVK